MKGQQRAYKKWGTVSFRYVFLFPDDREEVFDLNLDARTLDLLEDIPEELSSSTRLDFHQCQNCQLTIQKHPNCFVSTRLVKILVRERGVEPLRCYPLDPKSSASASSATLAVHFLYPIGGEIGRPVS